LSTARGLGSLAEMALAPGGDGTRLTGWSGTSGGSRPRHASAARRPPLGRAGAILAPFPRLKEPERSRSNRTRAGSGDDEASRIRWESSVTSYSSLMVRLKPLFPLHLTPGKPGGAWDGLRLPYVSRLFGPISSSRTASRFTLHLLFQRSLELRDARPASRGSGSMLLPLRPRHVEARELDA
jgi:hypothetical protein